MFLKYLEVQGFKSFPDKERIEFNKGIIGIVGPNGSGKSNISDAIRWVMGEQSIKSLRGGKMEDVIFSGTQLRKPVGFAEVSMCFDNSDRIFNVDYNEVLITRRYFRSGESEYYLNKSSCRLKDIHELLMDTGMGRDGYSIIGQGKIDEIITAKPEDRRVIIEEAAGISKYKYRKAESEKKIEQTKENLIRIMDLISEVESRVEPLRKDSEKAKKYLSLRDELKGIEISLNVALIDNYKESIEKLKSNIDICNKQIDDVHQFIDNNEREAQRKQAYSEQLEENQNTENEKLYEIRSAIDSLENEIKVIENNKEFSGEMSDRIHNEIKALLQKIQFAEVENSNAAESLEKVNATLGVLNSELEKLKIEFENISKENENADLEIEKNNNIILEHYKKLSEYKAEQSSLKAENEANRQKKLSIIENIEFKEDDIEVYQKRAESEKLRLEDEIKKSEILNNDLNSKRAEIEKQNVLFQESKSKLEKLTIDFENLTSQISVLEELEKEMEGYAFGVKTVIKESDKGALNNIKVYGTLAKVIDVPAEYSVAIEAVLGNNLQNVVVNNENDAKTAIEYLKRNKAGRVTFLPVSSVKGTVLDDSEFRIEKGYISIASKLVNVDEKFSKVVDDALGRTIIIDNIENAISFSKKFKQKYKIATLDGEIFNPGGSITGGNLSKNVSFLSRVTKIKNLKSKLDDVSQARKTISDKVNNISSLLLQLNSECDNLNTLYQLSQSEIYKTKYNLEHYTNVLNECTSEIDQLKANLADTESIINDNLVKIQNTDTYILATDREIETLNSTIDTIQQNSDKNSVKFKDLNNEIIKKTVEISDYESDKAVLTERIDSNNSVIKKAKSEIDEKNREIAEKTNKAFDDKINEIKLLIAEKENIKSDLENKILSIKAQREDCSKEYNKLLTETKEFNEKLVILSQDHTRIEGKLSRTETDLNSVTSRLWEDYELTYNAALEISKPVENPAEVQKTVNSLKNSIRALGDVNVGAIEEYAITKERYDFLCNQRDDLVNAKNALAEVISDIESLMTKQFVQQLEIINNTFSSIFKELFLGGEAMLVLSDEENVLSSGVEIIAQPPGKKLQNMTLFSGGEKAIIAISLIFALLEVRPSPLCVLDEIEAALDDVNVSRFARYLRKISKRSQIAIITHRRGTMEEADALYGVTMQEKGVSKLLHLDIDNIEQKLLK
ncbi:MAG: chromosome segregation protein SMC [Clostridia bacterium]|nr:chromosome segregation protein SMC [Clostridia bacterium]